MRRISVLLLFILSVLFASPSHAQDMVFVPLADAGVDYGSATDNFGSSNELFVEWANASARRAVQRSFMRFDITGVQSEFSCVTLRLTATASGGGDTHFEVRRVTGHWAEGNVTWDEQPGTGTCVGSHTTAVADGETIYISLDRSLARNGILELAIVGDRSGGVDEVFFHSREGSDPPQLILGCDTVPQRAGLAAVDREGAAPLQVSFDNNSSGDATSWSWDFGDGTTSSAGAPDHVYTTPGRYTVTLTATGPDGTDTHIREGYVFAHPEDQAAGSVAGWTRISQSSGSGFPPLDDEDMFGRSVDRLGDLDGDGIPELLVGSLGDDDALDSAGQDTPGIGDDNRGNNTGAAYVLFMNADGSTRAFQKISNLYGGLQAVLGDEVGFGRYVAGIGDLDGDGVRDACVTACRDDDGGSNRGALYILFLNADGTVRAEQKISDTEGGFTGSLSNDDQFGRGVTTLGDLDGDGVVDLATGATGDDDGASNRGAVWILFMNTDGTVKSHAKISDSSGGRTTSWDGTWFGMDVDDLGDIDGDGLHDLGVGTLLDEAVPHGSGGAFVLLMNADGTVKGESYINGLNGLMPGELEANDEFGGSVAGLGDLDGDGTPDMAVGSIRDDDNERGDQELTADYGAIFVFFLNPDGSVREYQKISDTRGNFSDRIDRHDRFAEALGAVGDWNGDGIVDLLAGTRFDDDGGGNRGAVHILYMNDGTYVPLAANFTATPTTGLAPLAVTFSDTSQGDVTAWSWNFGDGNTSTAQAPTHTYTNPGTYGVALTVTGPLGSDTRARFDLIVVTDLSVPVADFGFGPASGEAPLIAAFDDRSTGPITSYQWDFGDGTSSTSPSPVHPYPLPGTYDVQLTVTGPNGSDTMLVEDAIQVLLPSGAPVADFGFGPAMGTAPLIVAFDNRSSGAITGFLWDFGDGTTSTTPNPVHPYPMPGTYDVTLTATGPNGSDTLLVQDAVQVLAPSGPPQADFGFGPAMGTAPLIVAFDDRSTGAVTSYLWDFGDGTSSTSPNPVRTYSLPGTYDVTLTVTGPEGSDTLLVEDAVQVLMPSGPPVTSFGFGPGSGEAPLIVAFDDRSTGAITSYLWDFGDGTSSTSPNPVHPYPLAGTYDVTLTTTGPAGSDSLTVLDAIQVLPPGPPQADFGFGPGTGEAPLIVAFDDRSTGSVTSYLWDFGDGTSSTTPNPVHPYPLAGTYSVTLTTTGPGGSDTVTILDAIQALPPGPPQADFGFGPGTGEAPLIVAFDDRSTGSITSFLWDFGDGTGSTIPNPVHPYPQAGTYDVTLTVTGPAGSDTLVIADAIEVLPPGPPIADFEALPLSGPAPLRVTFQDHSRGIVTAFSWDFGDGGSSTLPGPERLFTNPGSYDVTLTVQGPGGSDTLTLPGYVQVDVPLPGLADGSFEETPLGNAPGSPWVVTRGTSHVVRDDATEAGYPSAGTHWLELSATGNYATDPPAQPLAFTEPSRGGNGIAQAFRLPPGQTTLAFEAAFLLAGQASSMMRNDWMSIDVSSDERTLNLYYRDSFSAFPLVSATHALPMTEPETVRFDLRHAFPLADENTPFLLRVQVGNGGDGSTNSIGYVDDFRLEPSDPIMERLGCGVNPLGSLTLLHGAPRTGFDLAFGLENPLGTQAPGAFSVVFFSMDPDNRYPCGLQVPGYGMNGTGELLISFAAPNPVHVQPGANWDGVLPVPIRLVVPDDPSLIDAPFYAQGLLYDASAGATHRIGFTDAFEMRVGAPDAGPLVLADLARGRPAIQSSDIAGGGAELAVDGSTNGDWAGGSVSHTALELEPFWEVDLGRVQSLETIVLWNRTDCCASRLDGAHVLVSERPFAGRFLTDLSAEAGVSMYALPPATDTAQTLALDRRGRYVRVQLDRTDYLQLAEVEVIGRAAIPSPLVPGLRASYYNELDFTDLALERIDPMIDFSWGSGSPDPAVDSDTFSVRWQGYLEPQHTELFTFHAESDDGQRLWVDGQLLVDDWNNHAPKTLTGTIELEADRRVPVIYEYYENGGGATARLRWSAPSVTEEAIPADRLFHQP